MATTLELIDHSYIERKSRRIARAQALKGRNVGKVRLINRRPPHAARLGKNAQVITETAIVGREGAKEQDSETKIMDVVMEQPAVCPKLLARMGNELSGLPSPCEMTAQSRRFVHDFLLYVGDAAYPSEFCKNMPDPNLTVWFQYMLVDEAYFHCFIALSEACMDFVNGKEGCSVEYRHHIATAMRLINEKLSGDNAVADTNLAGVIALCLLSSIREQPLQTKIHFDGLCRMIEVRGGMDALKSSPALIEKAHRIDVDLALQLGCATRLSQSAKTLDTIVPIFYNPAFEVRSPLMNAVRNADLEVFAATQNMMKVSRIFNSSVAAKKLGANAFQDIITTTCYNLLDIRPIDGPRSDMHPVANTIHLALMSFMTTFLIQFGRQRRLRYELLATKLMKALDNPKFQAAVDPATHLWLLVIAGISVLSKEDRIWLKPRLAEAVNQFGVTDWTFAKRLLSKYPWIGELHDQPAAKLWAQCFPPTSNHQ